MGEAKKRGSFEERKAAAIERDREKALETIRNKPDMVPSRRKRTHSTVVLASALAMVSMAVPDKF